MIVFDFLDRFSIHFFREHEEACDVLQQDIDSLESEKAELKEKIKAFSMKSMFAGITRTASGGKLKMSPKILGAILSYL